MLSVTDEISMVGFKQFQHMNQTVCDIKGATDAKLETSISFLQLDNLLYICHLTMFNH